MLRNLPLALAALLVLAAPAAAATPYPGALYTGKTSQDRNVAVRAGAGASAGQVRRFVIRWSTRCPGTTLTYTGRATLERLGLGPRGGFTGTLFYKETLDKGYRARVFTRLAGRFVSRGTATGRWRGAVRLFRYGKEVAYCRSALIDWTAKLAPEGAASPARPAAG